MVNQPIFFIRFNVRDFFHYLEKFFTTCALGTIFYKFNFGSCVVSIGLGRYQFINLIIGKFLTHQQNIIVY